MAVATTSTLRRERAMGITTRCLEARALSCSAGLPYVGVALVSARWGWLCTHRTVNSQSHAQHRPHSTPGCELPLRVQLHVACYIFAHNLPYPIGIRVGTV